MTAVTSTRPAAGRLVLHGVLLGSAVALGAGLALDPHLGAVAATAIGLVVLVAVRPVTGAALLIVASLLTAGVDRGVLIPYLRPQEAVLGLVLIGLTVSFAAGVVTRRQRLALRFERLDVVLLLLAILSSVLPLTVMYVRGEPRMEADDVLYALQLWKFYAVFLVFRVAVRTPREVGRCLWVTMGAAVVVGVVGVLQSLGLFGIQELMTEYFKPAEERPEDFDLTRATSTVGSPFAVGDIMTFSSAIAAAFLVRRHPRRLVLGLLAAFFLFAAISSGQFSIAIGILVAVVAFGVIHRRLGRAAGALLVVAVIGGMVLQPVIENRLRAFNNSAGLPQSWQGRIDNLDTYFLPVLAEDNKWLTGVRPSARVPTDEAFRGGYVWIESGYVWLLWTGGLALFLTFCLFLFIAMRRMARVARARDDEIGVAAGASFTALAVIAVLMVIDVHLTLRGAAELSFALLALGHPRPPEDLP